MSQNKTKPTILKVADFLGRIEDPVKRKDSREVSKLMAKLTGKRAKMWGSSIVGFGQYHYHYESGREGDYFLTGFSPRKTSLTIYIMPGFNFEPALMENLGTYKTGKSCLYIKRLDDIDRTALTTLIDRSVIHMCEKYDC
jgi:hypothetical protein